MKIRGLRSPFKKVDGLVYFGRMLDKIRLQAKGKLPAGFNVGDGDWYFFDARCVRFLGVTFAALQKRTLKGGTDLQILKWAYRAGRKPSAEEVEIWNAFITKRGWGDGSAAYVQEEKKASGLGKRRDIFTWFQLIDAQEGR